MINMSLFETIFKNNGSKSFKPSGETVPIHIVVTFPIYTPCLYSVYSQNQRGISMYTNSCKSPFKKAFLTPIEINPNLT